VQHSWIGELAITEHQVWKTVPESTVTFNSEGGPLLLNLDLTLYSASSPQFFGCRPMIDGRWAGEYGGYPVAPLWTEGLNGGPQPDSWFDWAKSRVYTGIPAGAHTLTVECMKYYEYMTPFTVGHAQVPLSLSIIELH
jgi:hypothetical protein